MRAVAPEVRTDGDPTLDFLTGTWRLRRLLHDDRLGLRGSFRGRAVVVPDVPDAPYPAAPPPPEHVVGASYREDGTLRWPGYHGPAGRSLRYEPAPGGGIEVRFCDGRLFHALDLGPGACEAVHPCGPDVYVGTTAVRGPDRFVQTWDVTGPDTALRIVSRYVRVGGM